MGRWYGTGSLEVVERRLLPGERRDRALHQRQRTDRAGSTLQFFNQEVARLGTQLSTLEADILKFKTENKDTLPESIDLLLARIALSRSDGCETDEHRINLLTLHSTKGLEFSRVYVVGVEDGALPGLTALAENREQEIQEARRLLYVGMTRAKDRLILTRAGLRGGRPTGGQMLLREAGLGTAPMQEQRETREQRET